MYLWRRGTCERRTFFFCGIWGAGRGTGRTVPSPRQGAEAPPFWQPGGGRGGETWRRAEEHAAEHAALLARVGRQDALIEELSQNCSAAGAAALAAQIEVVTKELLKRTPSMARRSMTGVCKTG